MDRMLLNEHDANQGAQSRGEFLGMTGNSGWYLLGSIGASLLIVILCWGMLGVSLLLCLFAGVVLCGLSVAYVFALKNNRPEHYDTDFFESALVEAGVLEMAFGPRARRLANPFREEASGDLAVEDAPTRKSSAVAERRSAPSARKTSTVTAAVTPSSVEVRRKVTAPVEPVVPLSAYEHVREELDVTEEMLEDVLTERAEV